MAEQTACVTGASSGIGLQLAKVFAQHGHPVVLVARRTGKLEPLAQELRSRCEVNITAVAHLTRLLLPGRIAARCRRLRPAPTT